MDFGGWIFFGVIGIVFVFIIIKRIEEHNKNKK